MVVIGENGYFEKGVWFNGVPKMPLVNAMVRTEPCLCPRECGDFLDYSYSIKGYYGPQDPKNEHVIFHGVDKSGCMVIEWDPVHFPGHLLTLKPYWNDGHWIEYVGEL